ncbi:hypothetical protein GUITHDRAFT_103642 [Guillardia theta CCMP2712]|uniref:UBA domain-containing protein n=1 Tax=Guillardia theta (strain CCMP2712) TaxID=905079 RepID=L1JQ59_GUITC|nr:hypothetical protein GUITHDRAFT_103642 [Guillardia theta CCMP2712]EKX50409.1 hypothetical protein GUITHDRAFT_103642 [Guillardia theta CCMP2712]|eukprot:XP_005837389.1 hypothetical protein GUITHDRAFT_103642 [Guillardia theta CCMP2712]
MEASDDESMLLLLILAPLLFFLFLKSCGKKHTNRDDEQRKKMVRQKADDRAEVVISSLSKPSTVSHRKESHGRQFEGIECEESEVPSEGIELENDRGRKESSSLLQESGENYSEEEEFPSLGKEQGRSPVLKGGTLVGQDRFKSAREFLSSSESVFQRLIKDGFSARAAIRSLLHHAESSSKVSSVSSTFYDCMTWICQSAAIIDVNAPWREEEILMIGEEYLQRFSDIENDLLRKYAHNSILNPKDDMLQSEQKIEREKSEEPLLRHETEQVIEAGKDDQNDWNVVLADDELNEDTVETNCEVDELEALKLEILDKTGFRVSDAVSFDDLLSSLNAKMCEAMTEDFWGVKYKSIPSQPDQIVKIAGGRRSEIALLVCFRVWQKLDCMSPACAAVARLSVMVNVGTLFKQGTLPLPPDVVPPVSSTDNLSSDLGRETAFLFQHENFSKDVFQSLSHPQSLSSCFFSQHLPCSLISINVEERMLPALLAVARGEHAGSTLETSMDQDFLRIDQSVSEPTAPSRILYKCDLLHARRMDELVPA